MTFEYELKQGVMSRWLDRISIGPAIRRGIRKALENLKNHFADKGSRQ